MSIAKRLLLMLTSLAIMLSICGCSFEANTSSDSNNNVIPETTTTAEATTSAATTTTQATTPETTTTQATTPETTTTQATTPETTTTQATTEAEPVEEIDVDLVMGSVVDGVYVNEYFDFSFAPSALWEFSDDDELMEMMGFSDGDSRQEKLSQKQLLYISVAYEQTTSSNVYVYAENLNIMAYGQYYDLETYAERDMEVSFSDYTFGDFSDYTIGSSIYLSVTGTLELSSYTVYLTLLYRKVDDFMLTIAVTTYDDADVSAEYILSFMSDADDPVSVDMHSVLGSADGRVYTNELLDLRIEVPTDWGYLSDEDLLDYSDIDPDDVTTEPEWQSVMYAMPESYAMVALELYYGRADIILRVENLAIDDGNNFDTAYEQTEYFKEQYEAEGVETSEIYYYILDSNTYYYFVAYNEVNNYVIDQTYLVRRVGDFMYMMVIETIEGDTLDSDDILSWMSDAN